MTSLLVVAGEASGDRAAAAVLARLRGVPTFGMGGGAMEAEGTELICDLRETTALGVTEVAVRACNVALSYARLRRAIAARKPTAALLVNYTEFNSHLAKDLWRVGTRVLWYGAPQIWAWRRNRGVFLRRHLDRMAVMLPFEENQWRELGVDARYVGHPALEEIVASERHAGIARDARATSRELLGLTPYAKAVAILPGSRPHEVRRLLVPMLEGFENVRRDRASVDGRVFLAPSLDAKTRAWARAATHEMELETVEVDAHGGIAYAIAGFDVALTASGTASLESALAGAVPIVCYRVGLLTELGARALMTTPYVALPNILLGRAAFPELLQRDATSTRIAEALGRTIDDRATLLTSCEEVRTILGSKTSASREVARMLAPWLGTTASEVPKHA